jgi:hypothetical protein
VEFFAQPLTPIDISLGGMRIKGNEEYRVGALLSIDIFFQRIAPATFTTVITWIEELRETGQARFVIGLSFVNLNPAAMSFLTSVLTSEAESGCAQLEVQNDPAPIDGSLEDLSTSPPARSVDRPRNPPLCGEGAPFTRLPSEPRFL